MGKKPITEEDLRVSPVSSHLEPRKGLEWLGQAGGGMASAV